MSFSSTSATPVSPSQDARMPPAPAATYERLQQQIAERKRKVGKVLTGNGITRYGNGAYSLIGGDELSDRGSVTGRG